MTFDPFECGAAWSFAEGVYDWAEYIGVGCVRKVGTGNVFKVVA